MKRLANRLTFGNGQCCFGVFPPVLVVTVMSAVPALRAATLPVVSTVATAVSLDFQITVLSDALAGKTVDVNVSLPRPQVTTLFYSTKHLQG